MNFEEKNQQMLKFLNFVYDVCSQRGTIESLTALCEDHGIPKANATKAFQTTGILEQISRGVFRWKSTSKPNLIMVSNIYKEITKIQKGYMGNRGCIKEEPKKMNTLEEVKRNAKHEAMQEFIKANSIASFFGVNITEMDEPSLARLFELISK